MKVAPVVMTLAWRNLWRNHRRTFIMLAAIGIGVWAMIFMTAFMRGMVNEMVRDGIRALPGHVQVHNPNFLDDPSIDNLIPAPSEAFTAALDRTGATWTSRIKVPAVITSERDSRGVTLIGVDPEKESEISFVADDIVDGRFLESPEDRGVIVGRKLLDTLETDLGKRVVVMTQDPENEIADRGFRIVGVFDASIESYEESLIFVGQKTLQQMLGIGDQVSEIAVMGDDYRNVEVLFAEVGSAVDADAEAKPWYELDNYLGTMLGVMDGFVLVWIIVIFLALSFGLVNTLVMAVFERIREIGLMLALGMKPRMILGQILVESFFLLVMGLAIGNVLGVVSVEMLDGGIDLSGVAEGMEMFGASSVLYPELTIADMMTANVIVVVLGFIASLSPAWRASRLDPIRAITKA
jgi:ABC-type lipoprotein release transport system permease subunit